MYPSFRTRPYEMDRFHIVYRLAEARWKKRLGNAGVEIGGR
jgi:hypothetical protein